MRLRGSLTLSLYYFQSNEKYKYMEQFAFIILEINKLFFNSLQTESQLNVYVGNYIAS